MFLERRVFIISYHMHAVHCVYLPIWMVIPFVLFLFLLRPSFSCVALTASEAGPKSFRQTISSLAARVHWKVCRGTKSLALLKSAQATLAVDPSRYILTRWAFWWQTSRQAVVWGTSFVVIVSHVTICMGRWCTCWRIWHGEHVFLMIHYFKNETHQLYLIFFRQWQWNIEIHNMHKRKA